MFIMTVVGAQEGVNKMIFTGDCLFEGGVGMFFEGNPRQMYENYDNLFNRKINVILHNAMLGFAYVI